MIFASNRWGNDTGINYKAEAQRILNCTMPREYTPEPRPNFGGFGGPGNGSDVVTSVRTMQTKKTTLHDFIITNGEIETQTAIEVFPSIGGKVVEMKVSRSIRTGKLL